MSKHIIDHTRVRNGSTKATQYARIEASERPHPQTKALQTQPRVTNSESLTKRFLDLDRRKGA